MGLFDFFSRMFEGAGADDTAAVNPATGEPMVGGLTGTDASGNIYGADSAGSSSDLGMMDMGSGAGCNTDDW